MQRRLVLLALMLALPFFTSCDDKKPEAQCLFGNDVPEQEQSDLILIVAIVEGDFETCFPIETTKRRSGHRFRMTLGEGTARMELETFDGDVVVCRPGT